MPQYSEVHGDVICPYCGKKTDDMLQFQWGRVPSVYSIGDKIKWFRPRNQASIECWRWYCSREMGEVFNCGDPAFENVIVLDCHIYDPIYEPQCKKCKWPLDGAAVFIREGRIAEIKALMLGDLEKMIGPCDIRPEIILVEADGRLRPMPEWNDHPLGT